MYQIAETLSPESIYQISRVAYRELFRAGVRTVGEFHYVHHQPDGTPYDDRLTLSEAVIRAARDEGMRIALLRVVYHRAGAGRPPEGAQRRFSDASLDLALSDCETLAARYRNDKNVVVGVAPHSVRAVPPAWLPEIADFAARHRMPLHMHVAEQPAEIAACLAETGKRPVELLAEKGILGERFVAVHATHLATHEADLLGESRSLVCLCPTTERDLGDGLPNISELRRAGVRLCVGVDSHVITQPFEDLRGIELGERLRSGKRVTLAAEGSTPAEELWRAGSTVGALACGFSDAGGEIEIDTQHPELALVAPDRLLDALVYSASAAVVRDSAR
jgi:formiminoglutamate deiminase